MPFRRTFAPVILTFTHSTETSLRHPGSVQFPTPLNWHGKRPSPTMFPEEPAGLALPPGLRQLQPLGRSPSRHPRSARTTCQRGCRRGPPAPAGCRTALTWGGQPRREYDRHRPARVHAHLRAGVSVQQETAATAGPMACQTSPDVPVPSGDRRHKHHPSLPRCRSRSISTAPRITTPSTIFWV